MQIYRKTAVGVVENNLDVGRDDSGPGAFVKKCLALFSPQVAVFIAQHELDGREEVGLARSITTH